MAKVRIGFSTHFEVENETVGIGTDSALDTLHVTGDITAHNIDAGGGITTVTTYEGFIDKEVTLTNTDINLDSKAHSLSGEIIIEGDITVSSGTTVTSGPENLTVTDNFTLPGISDDKPTVGTMRFNENLASLEFYTGVEWKAVNSYIDSGNRGRAVIYGGHNGSSATGTIEFINMSSQGHAVDFGTGHAGNAVDSVASTIRMVYTTGADNPSNEMEYITMASGGNGIEFGDQATYRYRMAAHSSSTRGLFMGGRSAPGTETSEIEYITISQLGNSLDFGDMHTNMRMQSSGMGSPTRAFTVIGYSAGSYTTEIQMVQIQSKGNAIDFGNSTFKGGYTGAASNSVRGFGFGGYQHPGANNYYSKEIFQLNLASQGNATDFGTLSRMCGYLTGTANSNRAFRFGGAIWTPTNYIYDDIDYWNITSEGNTMDFGNLTEGRYDLSANSDSHGGLGGF